GGGTITTVSAANFSGGTLTGGTWQASANSVLELPGDNIVTDAANILLDGGGSHVYSDSGMTDALGGLAAVATASSLTLENCAQESSTAPGFNSAGSVTIGIGSSFTLAGSYAQTAGGTTINGTLAPGGGLTLNGGTLNGAGTVEANVTNGGEITPGNMPG